MVAHICSSDEPPFVGCSILKSVDSVLKYGNKQDLMMCSVAHILHFPGNKDRNKNYIFI